MTTAKYRLEQATRAAEVLKEKLKAEFADDPELARDTIEGETGLEDLIAWASKEMLAAQALSFGIEKVLDDMEARMKRFDKRATNLRQTIEAAMLAGEVDKLEFPHVTLSIAKGGQPKVVITNSEVLPPDCLRTPPPVPDRTLIKKRLLDGDTIPGAELSNPAPHLTVRTK